MSRTALIVSHAHPDFSKGGAEMAAHGLYRGLRQTAGWDAHFLARHNLPGLQRPGRCVTGHGDGHEWLFEGETDALYFAARGRESLFAEFEQLLDALQPDVVHFHHYWQVGIELIRAVKRRRPGTPVLMTLHEFLAICAQNGQMTKSSGQLCTHGSPALCHACVSHHTVDDYFLRRRYIQAFFAEVDLFISPSHFLRQRYVDWGLPPERVVVMENGQRQTPAGLPVAPPPAALPRRFAYFGQITPYKGVDLLLEAFDRLPLELKRELQLDVHGAPNQQLPVEMQSHLDSLREANHRNLRFRGAYSADEVAHLLQGVDWVVVPSMWWENSPMVIQEAFQQGRPVICADIGGMAEKVRHDHDGLHFRARDVADLARVLEQAATTPGLWQRLAANTRQPPDLRNSAQAHALHYERLLARATPAA